MLEGNIEPAVKALEAAASELAKLDSGDEVNASLGYVHAGIADCYVRLGDTSKALDGYERAVRCFGAIVNTESQWDIDAAQICIQASRVSTSVDSWLRAGEEILDRALTRKHRVLWKLADLAQEWLRVGTDAEALRLVNRILSRWSEFEISGNWEAAASLVGLLKNLGLSHLVGPSLMMIVEGVLHVPERETAEEAARRWETGASIVLLLEDSETSAERITLHLALQRIFRDLSAPRLEPMHFRVCLLGGVSCHAFGELALAQRLLESATAAVLRGVQAAAEHSDRGVRRGSARSTQAGPRANRVKPCQASVGPLRRRECGRCSRTKET